MADNPWASYLPGGQLPSLDALTAPTAPAAPNPQAAPAATGTGNWLTAGLQSGGLQAAGQLSSAAQALMKVTGQDTAAAGFKAAADAARAKAATYARPDLEANPWSLPGIGYQVAQGLPSLGAFIGAGALAAAGAPEEAAGAGAIAAGTGLRALLAGTAERRAALAASGIAFPLAAGQNVQTNQEYTGEDINAGNAAKALALGIPEAALQGILPGHLEGVLNKGLAGGLVSGAIKGSAIQGAVGAVTTGLTSLMGDPNRTFADRAQDMLQAALSGGLQGGLFGGAFGALAKKPVAEVTGDDMDKSTAAALHIEPLNVPPAPEVAPANNNVPTTEGVANENRPGEVVHAPAEPQPEMDTANVALPEAANDNPQVANENRPKPPEPAGPAPAAPELQLERPAPIEPANDLQPANQNIGEQPPLAPVTPQPEMDTKNIQIKGVNDNPQVSNDNAGRVASEPTPDEIKQTIQQVAKTGKGLPPFLKGTDIKTVDDARQAIAKEIDARQSPGNSKPIGQQLAALADHFDVMGDDGKVRPELLAAPEDLAAAKSDVPTSTAPSIDAIPDAHKGKFTDLEKLRQTITDQKPDNMTELLSKVDDLQSRLQAPKRGDIGTIVKETNGLKTEVAGKAAEAARTQAEAPAKETPTAAARPEAAPKAEVAKAAPEIAPAPTGPSPKAQSFAERMKAAKQAKADAYAATKAQQEKAPPPKTQAEAKARAAAPAQQVAKPPPNPALNPLKAAIDNARKSLGDLMERGRVNGDIRAETVTNQTQAKRSAIKTAFKAPTDKVAAQAEARRQELQKTLDEQDKKLLDVQKIANGGNPDMLRGLYEQEKNAPVGQGHFGTKLWDQIYDTVDPQTQKMIAKHDFNEAEVIKQLKALHGDETPSVKASGPRTQGDFDLEHLINNGASGRDLLQYIRENGATGENKELANRLLASGADAEVGFAEPDKFKYDNDRALTQTPAGSYNDALKRVNVYDSSDMEATMLHEMAHAATQKALSGNGPAAREMRQLFDNLRERSAGEAYGLTNVHEMVAEAFSNPNFRDFLKGERAYTGSKLLDMWQAFKNIISKALGLTDRGRTALDQIMDRSGALMRENTGKGFDSESPRFIDNRLSEAMRGNVKDAADIADALKAEATGHVLNWTSKARELALGWQTGPHLAEVYGDKAPAMRDLQTHALRKENIADSLTKVSKAAQTLAHHLDKKTGDILNKVMQHTILNMDLEKSWAENTWLHADAKASKAEIEQAQRLQKAHADGQKYMNEIKRNPAAYKAYVALKDSNRANALAKAVYFVHDMVANEYRPYIQAGDTRFDTNPFDEFNARTELHDDPSVAAAHWDRVLNGNGDTDRGLLGEADRIARTLNAEATSATGTDATRAKARELSVPLRGLVDDAHKTLEGLKQGPYFHLGRDGTHFVSAKLALDENGLPDQNKLAKLHSEMEKGGFGDVGFQLAGDNRSVYIRLRDAAEAEGARKIFQDLHDKGVFDQSVNVAAGRSQDLNTLNSIRPGYIKRAIEALKLNQAEPPDNLSDSEKEAFIASRDAQFKKLNQALMDMMPDNSMSKIYQRREGVQGFNANMLHSFDVGSVTNSRGLAALSVSRDIGKANGELKNQIRALNQDKTVTANQREAYAQAASELMTRDHDKAVVAPSAGLDFLRHMTHTLQIGMSPAYFLTLMSQIGTLSLPKLGSTHGFLNSARSMAKVTPLALKVLSSMGHADAATFGLRHGELLKAGVSKPDADFIMAQAARGDFNRGGFTNSQVGHTGDGAYGRYLRAANTMSTYAEQIPRLITALAARELHRPGIDGDLHQFVSEKVNGSQLDWGAASTPRQLTRAGTFGKASPLINQFMGYQVRMTELLYRQGVKALGGDKEAIKFMLGHLAVTTALAGTMGLPFVGVAASVYDRLADLVTGSDSHDINASYRNFLASTFGKDVGEVIARGVPRAGGFDFARAGEGNIAPGSSTINMLTEKRKFEDAEKDWAKSMAGSAVGASVNELLAMRDFSNGDVMQGLVRLAPEGIKNIAEAVQLGTRGFVTKDGTPLPITASAQDVALKVLGLEGAKEQEYNEAKKTDAGYKALSQVRSQNITTHLLKSYQQGDMATFQKWQDESAQYAQDHPGMLPPIAGFEKALMEQMQGSAMARSLNTTIGIKPNDIVGRGMTSFGNFRNQ